MNKPTENCWKGWVGFSRLPHKIPAGYVTGAQAFMKEEPVTQQLLRITSPWALAWAVCCVGASSAPGSRSAEQHHRSPTPARPSPRAAAQETPPAERRSLLAQPAHHSFITEKQAGKMLIKGTSLSMLVWF